MNQINERNSVRFLFEDNKNTVQFVYRPPIQAESQIIPMKPGFKFATGVHLLDPWGFKLIGRNKWQRTLFRMKHPIVYSKRGLKGLWRKIKGMFIKEPPTILRRN